ncbi:MerR family DNA-binding transcriptional regulator [Paenibacillus sp. JTLBN-2024]
MYSIGQFVKIANISRRTLHYYNEIGQLPPAKVGNNQYKAGSNRFRNRSNGSTGKKNCWSGNGICCRPPFTRSGSAAASKRRKSMP